MGNSQTAEQYLITSRSDNMEEYFLPQYGGRVLVDKAAKLVYKTVTIDLDQEQDFTKMMQKRTALRHPHLAQIKHYSELAVEKDNLCSPQKKSYILTYDIYAYSLFNQIQICCKQKKPIPEQEICRIFGEAVQCLQYLQSQGTMHGDIKVSNIFMDKNRKVKLVDQFFLKQGKTSYEVVLQDPRSMSLLAPQQLQLLRYKVFDCLQKSYQRQMFMIGLSMIEATTIQEGMKCYDLDNLKIRDEFFIHMMHQIQSCGYSYALSNLIMNCVHRNPSSRPTFDQFLSELINISSLRSR